MKSYTFDCVSISKHPLIFIVGEVGTITVGEVGTITVLDGIGEGMSGLSVVKAWVGKIPHAPYISTETIAHGTMSCDCG